MALKGDTVRFEVKFKTFDGATIDPTDVKLNIYDGEDKAIDSIDLTKETNGQGTGSYYYDYTLPYGDDVITYEFFGMYLGKPVIARKQIEVKFSY